MSEKLLTFKEACRRLGIHPNTLRKWDKHGKLRVVRTFLFLIYFNLFNAFIQVYSNFKFTFLNLK